MHWLKELSRHVWSICIFGEKRKKVHIYPCNGILRWNIVHLPTHLCLSCMRCNIVKISLGFLDQIIPKWARLAVPIWLKFLHWKLETPFTLHTCTKQMKWNEIISKDPPIGCWWIYVLTEQKGKLEVYVWNGLCNHAKLLFGDTICQLFETGLRGVQWGLAFYIFFFWK